MALRIGEYVYAGELRNLRRNSVFGWLEFAPDYGVRIELTGNLSGDLAGKHIRFKSTRHSSPPDKDSVEEVAAVQQLADRQIGVVGEMLLRRVKMLDMEPDEVIESDPETLRQNTIEKDCLYLEWFSQNGRVVAEITDMDLLIVDDQGSSAPSAAEAVDDGRYEVGFTEIHIDEDGVAHTRNFELSDEEEEESESDEDPYGLFDKDLGDRMAAALGLEQTLESQLEHAGSSEDDSEEENQLDSDSDSSDSTERRRRPWDEVIPGIDEETKALYEQWDEIFDGRKDEPISGLFETPLKLPKVEHVISDEQAEPLVRSILAQLALLNVALDMCEHFSELDTYRLLMEEILPTAKVHPNLSASDMVLHFSTSDYCQECSDEFDAEYESLDGEQDSGATESDDGQDESS